MIRPDYRLYKRVCVVEDYECPFSLGELKAWVDRNVLEYGEATEVRLEVPRWEDEGSAFCLYQYQPKTQQELEAQDRLDKQHALLKEQQERALFLQLYKKYAE